MNETHEFYAQSTVTMLTSHALRLIITADLFSALTWHQADRMDRGHAQSVSAPWQA